MNNIEILLEDMREAKILLHDIGTEGYLNPEHIEKIINTYQHRKEEKRYARRVTLEEIKENDYNLNISRYVSTAEPEPEIDIEILLEDMREAKILLHDIGTEGYLNPEHIEKIINTYQHRKEEKRYARRVTLEEIKENDYNLNISRYVSTAEPEPEIDLKAIHAEIVETEKEIRKAKDKHNSFLEELGLPPLP